MEESLRAFNKMVITLLEEFRGVSVVIPDGLLILR